MNTINNTKKTQKRRLVAGILAVIWAMVIFVFSAIPGESYPSHPGFLNYIAHFGEYFLLAALIATALYGSRLKTWQVVLIAIALSSAYAASDEFHQLFVAGRSSDPVDWIVDTLGASTGALLTTIALRKIHRK